MVLPACLPYLFVFDCVDILYFGDDSKNGHVLERLDLKDLCLVYIQDYALHG